ncbi:unnamed protein product [Amoebophrya sp. A25]|nr:unnamed protein product [Amoebophrya sp. A25]|eukprot:GSA25T00001907001.1
MAFFHTSSFLLVCLLWPAGPVALDDGLARRPPMGWRTWNAFADHVTQPLLEKCIRTLATELAPFGYTDIGLDDNWQACGAGVGGGFHDANGMPIINADRFPDMKSLVSSAHANNLTMGWYGNNCICAENGLPEDLAQKQIRGDVKKTIELGFDGIKLDGCGQKTDLPAYLRGFQNLDKKIVIENCHWGADLAHGDQCPYHFARSGPDIRPTWEAMFLNLQSLNLASYSGPGCWAYPDMLEVGNSATAWNFTKNEIFDQKTLAQERKALSNKSEGTTLAAASTSLAKTSAADNFDRTNFGAWCVTSSPLVLSFDLTDTKKFTPAVKSVVTNQIAISINQLWAGDRGRLVYSWEPNAGATLFMWAGACDNFSGEQEGWFLTENREPRWRASRESKEEFCVDTQSGTAPKLAILRECTTFTPSFVYDAEGRFVRKPSGTSENEPEQEEACLQPFTYSDISYGYRLGTCDAEEAAELSLNALSGRLYRTSVVGAPLSRHCVAVKTSAPMGANTLQLWAKKLPTSGAATVGTDSALNLQGGYQQAPFGGQEAPSSTRNEDDVDERHLQILNDALASARAAKVSDAPAATTVTGRQAVLLINSDGTEDHTFNFSGAVMAQIFRDSTPSGSVRYGVFDVWGGSIPAETIQHTEDDAEDVKVIAKNKRNTRFYREITTSTTVWAKAEELSSVSEKRRLRSEPRDLQEDRIKVTAPQERGDDNKFLRGSAPALQQFGEEQRSFTDFSVQIPARGSLFYVIEQLSPENVIDPEYLYS